MVKKKAGVEHIDSTPGSKFIYFCCTLRVKGNKHVTSSEMPTKLGKSTSILVPVKP